MEKKRVRLRPFRILSVFLGIAAVSALADFPDKAISAERQREQLLSAATAYYDAQSRRNELAAELSESNSVGFIERTARREYGYCWYGETIYEVANLEEIREDHGFEIYGEQ